MRGMKDIKEDQIELNLGIEFDISYENSF